MFSKVLVPLDGTAEANTALPLARTIAQTCGSSVTLLRVVRPDAATSPTTAADILRRIGHELGDSVPGGVTTLVVQSDAVADEILDQIRARSAELVIMRTHGRAGIGRAILGSVTQEVLARSPVPVLLLRPGGRRVTHIRTVLVPIDGSPGSALALGTAVEVCRTTGASMKLLQVSVPVPVWTYTADAYGGMSYYDPVWDEESLASARTYVQGVIARLRAANVEAEGEARQEPLAAETIVATADTAEADLIIMSTRALTGPARALLGSTADAVVRLAHCPVLLIHRNDDAAPSEYEPDTSAAAAPVGV